MHNCANSARLEDTCRRLLVGRASVNQLIEDGRYLVAASLRKSIRRFGLAASRMADELESVGNLELVRIANKQDRLDPDTICRRIGCRIRRAMRDALQQEGCLTPVRRQREGTDAHRYESLSEAAAGRIAAPEDRSSELLEDIWLGCCGDDMDRSIVRLRSAGHTDAEAASLVGLSESTVRNRRQAIYAAFQSRNPEYSTAV